MGDMALFSTRVEPSPQLYKQGSEKKNQYYTRKTTVEMYR